MTQPEELFLAESPSHGEGAERAGQSRSFLPCHSLRGRKKLTINPWCLQNKPSVLQTVKIFASCANLSDQRERTSAFRAVARCGWRPCRPVGLVALISCTVLKNASVIPTEAGMQRFLPFAVHCQLLTENGRQSGPTRKVRLVQSGKGQST